MTMKHDYTRLDASIVECIAACGGTPLAFHRLSNLRSVLGEATRIADAGNVGKPERLHTQPWRIVDRRLQALRKAGRIIYQRKPEGWSLVKS